jgi:hypothetical protein
MLVSQHQNTSNVFACVTAVLVGDAPVTSRSG